MGTAEVELAEVPQISHEELVRRIGDRSLILVDVLAPESYRSGHLPGAINLPLADLPQRVTRLIPNRSQEIAIYCGSPT
ncbi:MAG TPA: rhodanese-like domain-containing protein [Vicinamibacterales bacterium]|nr:rhodanese-like domain-containing protein [Vicinamibacterales bacterium]